jgi:hypothetical protein
MPLIQKDYYDEKNYIRNIRCEFSDDGNAAVIQWDWPENSEYQVCFAFDVTEEEERNGITLEELLNSSRPRGVIDAGIFHPHRVNLTQAGIRVYLYPAAWDKEQNDYRVLDQQQQNKTENLRQRATIYWKVEYRDMGNFFRRSPYRKATIFLSGITRGIRGYLVYRCIGGRRSSQRFAIDLELFGREPLEIIIDKNEKVVLDSPSKELAQMFRLIEQK